MKMVGKKQTPTMMIPHPVPPTAFYFLKLPRPVFSIPFSFPATQRQNQTRHCDLQTLSPAALSCPRRPRAEQRSATSPAHVPPRWSLCTAPPRIDYRYWDPRAGYRRLLCRGLRFRGCAAEQRRFGGCGWSGNQAQSSRRPCILSWMIEEVLCRRGREE